MSYRQQSDRRAFIRKSLGAAPLVLTLGSRSYETGTSTHGTLWSSLGTRSKHHGNWRHGRGFWKRKDWDWSSGEAGGDHEYPPDGRSEDWKGSGKGPFDFDGPEHDRE